MSCSDPNHFQPVLIFHNQSASAQKRLLQAALEKHQKKTKKTVEATVGSAAAKAVSLDAAVAEVLSDLDLFCHLKKKKEKQWHRRLFHSSPISYVHLHAFHKCFLWALYLMDNGYLKCFPNSGSGPEMFVNSFCL